MARCFPFGMARCHSKQLSRRFLVSSVLGVVFIRGCHFTTPGSTVPGHALSSRMLPVLVKSLHTWRVRSPLIRSSRNVPTSVQPAALRQWVLRCPRLRSFVRLLCQVLLWRLLRLLLLRIEREIAGHVRLYFYRGLLRVRLVV